MLKINLLPPYIYQRSKIRTAWMLMAALLAAELVGLTLFQASLRAQEKEQISTVQNDENQVVQVQKLASDAQAERLKIAPIKEKTDFIKQLLEYNLVRPNLYGKVASYIYQEVWVSGMQAEQNILTMPASAKNISGVGRFLLFMQNSPDFSQVRISSVPGWPPGTAGVEAGAIGGDIGGGAAMGGRPGYGAPPGYGGGPGGPPGGGSTGGAGGPAGGPPIGGYGTGGGPGGPPGGPPGGGYGTGGEGGALPGGGPPIFGGGGAAGGEAPGLFNAPTPAGPDTGAVSQGGAPIPYPRYLQPKPQPTYFQFTVTGLLTKPIVRPTYQGVGSEGTDTGGYGSYGASTGGPGGPPGYGAGGPGGPPGYGAGGPGGPAGGPPGGPPGYPGPPGGPAGSAGPGGPSGSGK
jgi:hypothetical protein